MSIWDDNEHPDTEKVRRLRNGIKALIEKYERGQNHDESAFDADCEICLILRDLRALANQLALYGNRALTPP